MAKPKRTVEIACEGASTLPWAKLSAFQGESKSLSVDDYKALRSEIENRGFRFPIHIWKAKTGNHIIDGHQRLRVVKTMVDEGWECPPLPVTFIKAKNMEDAKQSVIAGMSQYGKIDRQGLYEFMSEAQIPVASLLERFSLPDFNIKSFAEEFFESAVVGKTDPDDIPEVAQNEFGVERGQVWQLGAHRLVCGDSTSAQDVAKLIGDEKADMVFTDPPYGLGNKWSGGTWAKKQMYADAKKWDQALDQRIIDWLMSAAKIVIIWGGNYYRVPPSRCWLAWNKTNSVETMGDFELAWTNIDSPTKRWDGAINSDGKRSHPTQKPVGLMEWAIGLSEESRNILDPFLGSGSTLIACEKTGRRCFGMDIDPHYCSVIIKRWQDFTGKKAELVHPVKIKKRSKAKVSS